MDERQSLITAYYISLSCCQRISGDIPALLSAAFMRQYRTRIPSKTTIISSEIDHSAIPSKTVEALLEVLENMPRLQPIAQVLIKRVCGILTKGPVLTTAEPDTTKRPLRIYNLPDGVFWTIFMASGADSDLEDTEAKNRYTDNDKAMWFMCKKAQQAHAASESEGTVKTWHDPSATVAFQRCYAGRLFARQFSPSFADDEEKYARVDLPFVKSVASKDGRNFIAVTSRGLYGWGYNVLNQLGMDEQYVNGPTRLTFSDCQTVAEYEASLPSWHKDKLVNTVSVDTYNAFILTPAGVIIAGSEGHRFSGKKSHSFQPVPMPDDFVPDHILTDKGITIFAEGDRQVIKNDSPCRTWLGINPSPIGFVDLPFHVDEILYSDAFRIKSFVAFLCGNEVIFAGTNLNYIHGSGLLPGRKEMELVLPTPLKFPGHISRVLFGGNYVLWVSSGQTVCSTEFGMIVMPVETKRFGFLDDGFANKGVFYFKDVAGDLYAVSSKDMYNVTDCEGDEVRDDELEETIPVDVC
ncbi:Prokaryotic membrane lipoprotein lipid attachment site [Carpediemonas membranifera]|uniref:Prokaryotic membrane lipoprotein lipid attachment site n=1 Tax=Carpediemonas membranifera TaxID=201153 RepID=A0A8J6E0W1_9EUKA|nr:Prokaryotic membrane lipoprotein lipid attachment site [Carpediemonas membranifera]|eukprot:KAG9389842.1 Prokaryotic membrane lipoprotein lipid attachment site [Carpediemonas membranifera]